MITPISNSQMLAQMEMMKTEASNTPLDTKAASEKFGNLFVKAIERTNSAQMESAELTRRFVSGDQSVSAADLMRVNHKAEISSEISKQVRNKMLEHYKEITNTQL